MNDIEERDGTNLEVSLEQRADTIRKARTDMVLRLDEADRAAHEHYQRSMLEIELSAKRELEIFMAELRDRTRQQSEVAQRTLTLELEHVGQLRKQIR